MYKFMAIIEVLDAHFNKTKKIIPKRLFNTCFQ